MFKLEDLPRLADNLPAPRDAFEKYGKHLVPLVRHMIALNQGLVADVLLIQQKHKKSIFIDHPETVKSLECSFVYVLSSIKIA